MSDYPSQSLDRFMVRLPEGWRDVIKTEAMKNRRSMNAEVVDAIEVAMRVKGVRLDAAA